MPNDLGLGLAGAMGGLVVFGIAAWLLSRVRPAERPLPVAVPLGVGYLLGAGGLDLFTGPAAARALQLALGLGAGWIALDAAAASSSTFRRAASRSGITWAAAAALLGPSCIAGGLSPVISTVYGPAGLSIASAVIVVSAAILADPQAFRSSTLTTGLSSHRVREAIRTSDAFHACALFAWPLYWAVARMISAGEGFAADTAVASVGISYGVGVGLGIVGMFLVRISKWGLAIAGVILAVALAAAIAAPVLTVSSVASCFVAGAIMGQDQRHGDPLFAVARRLARPFRLMMLTAAGAACPRWSGLAAPVFIVLVVLLARWILGSLSDVLASVAPTAASGRRFGWVTSVPSPLGAAMVAEATLLLALTSAPVPLPARVSGAGAGPPGLPAEIGAGVLPGEFEGALPAAPAFLLALAIGDILWKRLVGWRLRTAIEPAVTTSSGSSSRHRHHGRHRHHRSHRSRSADPSAADGPAD